MKTLLMLALALLPITLGAQTPPAKATRNAPVLQQGQVALLWVDTSGHLHVKIDSLAFPANHRVTIDSILCCSTLDSIRAIAWMDSLKRVDSITGISGTVRVQLTSGADSVQLRTGTKHAARVAVDSILANSAHIGRVAVDSLLGIQATDTGLTSVCNLAGVNQACVVPTSGYPWVGVEIDSTLNATLSLVFEVNPDSAPGVAGHWVANVFWNGDAWVSGDVLPAADGLNPHLWVVPFDPADKYVRVRVLTYTSGTVKVSVKATRVTQFFVPPSTSIDSVILPAGSGAWNTASMAPMMIGGYSDDGRKVAREVQVVDGVPVQTDRRLVVAPLNQSRASGATGTSLGALNASVQTSVEGYAGAGVWIDASTLVGTLTFEVSAGVGTDTNWVATTGLNAVTTSTTSVNPGANIAFTLLLASNVRLARVRVSAFTSGSATVKVIATSIVSGIRPELTVDGAGTPTFAAKGCFGDTAATRVCQSPTVRKNSTPVTTDLPLVVSLAPQSAGLIFPATTDSTGWVQGKNAADSILLPAKAGLRHYIYAVCWSIVDSTTSIAAAAPDTVTTTNLAATPIWLSGNTLAGGGTTLPFGQYCQNFTRPLVANAQNTITKFRGNATGLHTIETLEVHYYLGP